MMEKTSFCPQAMLFTMSYPQYCNDYFFHAKTTAMTTTELLVLVVGILIFFSTNALRSFILDVLVSCSANARPRRGHTRLE
jgi:hypothetical protein